MSTTEYEAVLSAAQQLSAAERLRLIETLSSTIPVEAETPLHEDWALELERRVKALEDGSAETIPWNQVRNEALARIGHGKIR